MEYRPVVLIPCLKESSASWWLSSVSFLDAGEVDDGDLVDMQDDMPPVGQFNESQEQFERSIQEVIKKILEENNNKLKAIVDDLQVRT